jgi:methionyl-tRNA formyltransferase
LKELASARNVPCFQPGTYKSDETFEQYKALAPDLCILAFVTAIIPPRYFDAATRGGICYHPSILPRHRGGSAINWALISGDTRTGLTIFWPDGGIDTGPILVQKEIEIAEKDTTGSLYFNQLFPMGIDAILESVTLIKENRAPRIEQDESNATYEPLCNDKVAGIDWQTTSREIFNLVRGCDPQPGAFTFKGGEKVRFFEAAWTGEVHRVEPGTILRIDESGLTVAAEGGCLNIGKLRGASGGKLSANAWAEANRIKAGDRFEGSL